MSKSEQNLKKLETENTKVEVSLPSRIQIELVQGNELRHYEIFSFASSLLLSTAVGFWTGYLTLQNNSKSLLASASAFSILFFVSAILACYYRQRLYNGKVTKVANLDSFS